MTSIRPVGVAEWSFVQCFPMMPPLRHVSVHEPNESLVVMRFHEMHELMRDQVLQTLDGLLRKLEVQPDSPGVDPARAPLGLHAPDTNLGRSDSPKRLPFGHARSGERAQALAIPPPY